MRLNRRQRSRARKNAVRAALYCVARRGAIHYTQGQRRWDGLRYNMRPGKGTYPHYADCSSFATWCLWVGFKNVRRNPVDVVNGVHWTGGYTGTMLAHGQRVRGRMLPGDLVIYGNGFPGHHVAIYIGGGRVASHGSEAGPMILPVHYRPDVMSIRRYI